MALYTLENLLLGTTIDKPGGNFPHNIKPGAPSNRARVTVKTLVRRNIDLIRTKVNPRSKTPFEKLPPQIWHQITDNLTLSSEASLAFSCRQALKLLGRQSWIALRLDRPEKLRFLELIDSCMPLHILCPICAVFHRRVMPVTTCEEHLSHYSPPRYCENAMDYKGMSLIRRHHLNWSTCHLILRAHRLGPRYGVPGGCTILDSPLEWYEDWYRYSGGRIVDDRLLIRVEALRPLFNCWDQDIRTQVQFWNLPAGTTCPHPSTIETLSQACLGVASGKWPPKKCTSKLITCPLCPTEYIVRVQDLSGSPNIHRLQPANRWDVHPHDSHHKTNYFVSIERFHDLGECRASSAEWTALTNAKSRQPWNHSSLERIRKRWRRG